MRALFVVLVLGACAVAAYVFLAPTTLPEHPLDAAPEGTAALLRVDVGAVLGSSLWQTFVTERGGDRALRRMQERCEVDPAAQVERLEAFVGGDTPDSLDAITVMARGPFEHERLGDCMKDVVEEGGGSLRRVELDGVPAVAGGRGDSRIAFLGADGAVFGREEAVRRVIATARGQRPSARETEPLLSELWQRVAEPAEVGLAARVPQNWQDAIERRMSREVRGLAAGLLTNLRAVALGARVSRGLGLGVVLRYDGPDDAEDARRRLQSERDRAMGNPLVALSAAGPALSAVGFEVDGPNLTAAVDLSQRRVDALVELWREMREARER